jgi:hypothetical protein
MILKTTTAAALACFTAGALTADDRGALSGGYVEDFELFELAPIDGQQGWRSPNPNAEIATGSAAIAGRSAVAPLDLDRSEWSLVGPAFPAAHGRLETTVRIAGASSDSFIHHVAAEDPTTGFLLARVGFTNAGQVIAYKPSGGFGPSTDSFVSAGPVASFAPGQPFALALEADPDGEVRIEINGALVHTTTDLFATILGPDRSGKIGRLAAWSSLSVGDESDETTIALDDIAFTPRPCPADLNADGAVDIVDLSLILQRYPDLRPGGPADINADGAVDIVDVVLLINAWGLCD